MKKGKLKEDHGKDKDKKRTVTPCALIYFVKMVCCTTIETGMLSVEVKIFKLYPFFFSSGEAEDILPAV